MMKIGSSYEHIEREREIKWEQIPDKGRKLCKSTISILNVQIIHLTM